MSMPNPTNHIEPSTLEQVLALLIALSRRRDLPPWRHLQADTERRHMQLRVAGYEDVRAWSVALHGPAEPDRQSTHDEGIVWWSAYITGAPHGWAVEIIAKVVMPISIALNDDMLDAVELVPALAQAVGA